MFLVVCTGSPRPSAPRKKTSSFHRRGLHRQCRLHPLVRAYKFAVAKREQVGRIVGVAVLPLARKAAPARGEFA